MALRQLLVILGAGASHDCASEAVDRNTSMQPPLVKDLFDRRFSEILNEYPLAEQIAPDVRIAVESGSIALEAYLRDELLNSPYPHFRRRYQAVPLYLQHLLWAVGRDYTPQPDNIDRLITETFRFERVCFVTLNYDTILDRRLELEHPITTMFDYVRADSQWSLLKLHGSINWGRRVMHEDAISTRSTLAALSNANRRPNIHATSFSRFGEEIPLSDEVELMPGSHLSDYRVAKLERSPRVGGRYDVDIPAPGAVKERLMYPALAAPLGPQDSVMCPSTHLDVLDHHLTNAFDGVNVLVIGYSGLDDEVLKLLANKRPVRSIKVVNGSMEHGMAALQIFGSHLGFEPTTEMAFPGGFTEFAQTTEMANYLRDL